MSFVSKSSIKSFIFMSLFLNTLFIILSNQNFLKVAINKLDVLQETITLNLAII